LRVFFRSYEVVSKNYNYLIKQTSWSRNVALKPWSKLYCFLSFLSTLWTFCFLSFTKHMTLQMNLHTLDIKDTIQQILPLPQWFLCTYCKCSFLNDILTAVKSTINFFNGTLIYHLFTCRKLNINCEDFIIRYEMF